MIIGEDALVLHTALPAVTVQDVHTVLVGEVVGFAVVLLQIVHILY